MLAMVVNDDAFIRNVRGVLEFIASVLAPTGDDERWLTPRHL